MNLHFPRRARPLFVYRWWMAATLALAMFVPALTARAQGTSGTLPDPITSQELAGYANRLKLSDQQRAATNMLHDQYKTEFRTLREGEIAGFLKDMRSLQGHMPGREAIESFIRKMDQLNDKIAILDNRLFDQVQAVLTDDQLADMPRVRLARQRARFSGQQMMWMGGGHKQPDLSEIAFDLNLDAATWKTIDPTLAQYERTLTNDMSKLYESVTKMMLKLYDAIEGAGFNEESMQDPETAEKMGQMMQEVWREIMADVSQHAGAISDLNQRTHKSIATSMPTDAAQTLRERYHRDAYPEVAPAYDTDGLYFRAALKHPDLTAQQREAIMAASDDYHRRANSLIDEVVELILNNRKDFSPFDFNSERMQEQHERVGQLHARITEMKSLAAENLRGLLGPELAERIVKQSDTDPDSSGKSVANAMAKAAALANTSDQAPESAGDSDAAEEMVSGSDLFLPPAISARELAQYNKRLAITDDQRPVVQQLYSDYQTQFKAVQDVEIAAVNQATQSMWKVDPETQSTTGPTTDMIEETYRRRRAALEAIRRVDKAFFDDIEMACLTPEQVPHMKRVRNARECATLRRGQTHGYVFGGTSESTIDVSRLVQRQQLGEAVLKAIDPEMIAYEETAAKALQTRYDAGLDMQRAHERWQAEVSAMQSDSEGNPMKLSTRFREILGEVSKRMSECDKQMAALNRQTLQNIIAALPIDSGRALRNDYNRRAYPDVYTDQGAMEDHLNRAMKLEDLTQEQRQRVNDLAAEYRPAYAQFSEEMVLASATMENVNMAGFEAEDWKKFQERQDAVARLKFDRTELNSRAIVTLRAILSEDQVRHLGGLPDPARAEATD